MPSDLDMHAPRLRLAELPRDRDEDVGDREHVGRIADIRHADDMEKQVPRLCLDLDVGMRDDVAPRSRCSE